MIIWHIFKSNHSKKKVVAFYFLKINQANNIKKIILQNYMGLFVKNFYINQFMVEKKKKRIFLYIKIYIFFFKKKKKIIINLNLKKVNLTKIKINWLDKITQDNKANYLILKKINNKNYSNRFNSKKETVLGLDLGKTLIFLKIIKKCQK